MRSTGASDWAPRPTARIASRTSASRVRDRPDPALHGTPSCPWAFSAERQRLRLLWLYGDQIDWELHMVVLSETPPEEFTPERLAAAHAGLLRTATATSRRSARSCPDAPRSSRSAGTGTGCRGRDRRRNR